MSSATKASSPSVKAVAIRLLARREYGRLELGERLMARGHARDDVNRALDELERSGYLSDRRFAHALVAQKAGRYARRAIEHELKHKHVAPAAAREALSALSTADELAEAT